MTSFKNLLLMSALVTLAACGKKAEDGKPPEATPAPAAPTSAAPAPAAAPKLASTAAFDCATGGRLELREFDDKLVRVTIGGQEHVLTPVTIDGGTLLQGDNISVRLFDDQATASDNGVVLHAGCKKAQ